MIYNKYHTLTIVSLIFSLHTISLSLTHEQRQDIFFNIFHNNLWHGTESISGTGSSLETTATLRLFLPTIIKMIDAKTVVDVGCGDFNWMRTMALDLEYYVGIDIVPNLIQKNNELYTNDKRIFMCLDIVKDAIPNADIIICRDVLQHLPLEDGIKVLTNIKKSDAKYLLTTNYFNTTVNTNIGTGNFYKINLLIHPFNLSRPLLAFEELSAEPEMRREVKNICLWQVKDVPYYNELVTPQPKKFSQNKRK